MNTSLRYFARGIIVFAVLAAAAVLPAARTQAAGPEAADDFVIKVFREMEMQPSLERALRRKDILKA